MKAHSNDDFGLGLSVGTRALRRDGEPNPKPRLLICIGEYVAGNGQTRVVENELKGMLASYDVTLIAPRFAERISPGVQAVRISSWNPRGLVRLARLMRDSDVVHLHDTLAHMVVATLACPRRWVVTCHGIAPPGIRTGVPEKIKGYVTLSVYPLLYRRAAKVVTISGFLGTWLRRRGIQNHAIILWGAPEEISPPAGPPAGKRLVYIGEVSYRKGIDLLIQGIALCPPDVALDVVGSGDLEWAAQLIEQQGLKDRIALRGHVGDPTVAALLDEALAVVSFSRWEGFGLPIVEGFSRGRPAIVLGGSAMEELVTNAGGGVVVNQPSGLPAAVKKVEQQWRSMSESALAEASRLRWSSTWSKYEAIFRAVYGESGRVSHD